ncbi:MAG: hypothetical protein KDD89_05060, partial [Anaerolineales bacterium]|nr:hypothetical protein [Anaerolineales bacterium]
GQIAIGLYDALAPDQPRQSVIAANNPGTGTIRDHALHIGQINIEPPAGEVPNQMAVRFGDNITLVGYTFSQRRLRPGDTLTVTLYWQARGAVGKEYTAFVHLLDANGEILAQTDRPPAGYPTSDWRPGECIQDTFVVPLPAGAQSTAVRTGFYDPATLQPLAEPFVLPLEP